MTDREKKPSAPTPATPARRGTAVAPPPAAPPPRPEGWVPPAERVGWRCRRCAGFSGKTYTAPTSPDETCVECQKPVDPVEAQTAVMDRLAKELAKNGLAGGRQPSTTPRPTNPPAKPLPWCDVAEAGALLGCRRTKVFELIRQGRLDEAPDAPGRGTHVTRASVLAYQEQVAAGKPKKAATRRRQKTGEPKTAEPAAPSEEELRAQRKRLFE